MSESPFRSGRSPDGGRYFSFDLQAQTRERQRKGAIFGSFEILCDEGIELGGDDSAPPPLAYFAAAIAF